MPGRREDWIKMPPALLSIMLASLLFVKQVRSFFEELEEGFGCTSFLVHSFIKSFYLHRDEYPHVKFISRPCPFPKAFPWVPWNVPHITYITSKLHSVLLFTCKWKSKHLPHSWGLHFSYSPGLQKGQVISSLLGILEDPPSPLINTLKLWIISLTTPRGPHHLYICCKYCSYFNTWDKFSIPWRFQHPQWCSSSHIVFICNAQWFQYPHQQSLQHFGFSLLDLSCNGLALQFTRATQAHGHTSELLMANKRLTSTLLNL